MLAQHYGLPAQVTRLEGERDDSFLVTVEGQRRFVLKISHPAQPAGQVDFQTAALRHLACVGAGVGVPHVMPTLDGRDHFCADIDGGPARSVRLLSFVDGMPMNLSVRSVAQSRSLGAVAARLGLALRGFFHRAAGHALSWDIKHAARLRGRVKALAGLERRALAQRFLDGFESNAMSELPRLRAQVVHNDLNPFNVLTSPQDHTQIVGILDFGDMVHTPLIADVAVAASYQFLSPDPWESVRAFVAAYHQASPLHRDEVALLYDLIGARLVTTVAITEWRASRHPSNRDYILRNNPAAWAGLECLARLPRPVAQRSLLAACALE